MALGFNQNRRQLERRHAVDLRGRHGPRPAHRDKTLLARQILLQLLAFLRRAIPERGAERREGLDRVHHHPRMNADGPGVHRVGQETAVAVDDVAAQGRGRKGFLLLIQRQPPIRVAPDDL